MTPNRAQSILNSSLNGSLSMTDAERASVQKAQVYNPNSNFLNVLLKIAEGEIVAEDVQMVGIAVFCYGTEIIEQTPVYMGEHAGSEAVYARAVRHIETLAMPANEPVQGNDKLQKLQRATMKFHLVLGQS